MTLQPYPLLVPFEQEAGPYFWSPGDPPMLVLDLTEAHADSEGRISAGALMGFADFAMYVLVNHFCANAYNERIARGGETIVTQAFGAEILRREPSAGRLLATGCLVNAGRRQVHVQGTISDERDTIMGFHGTWSRTVLSLDPPLARAIVQGDPPASPSGPYDRRMGLYRTAGSPDLRLRAEPRHCNLLGIVHGGMLLGLAAEYRLASAGLALRSLSMDFLAPAFAGQLLAAEAAFHRCDSTAISHGRIVADGRPICRFSASYG